MLRDRLKAAIQQTGRTVHQVGNELVEAGVPGGSYYQLRRILDGSKSTLPTLDWVEGVADHLGVRRAWLAFGSGAMTDKEEEARTRAAEYWRDTEDSWIRLGDGFLDGLGIPSMAEADDHEHPDRVAAHREGPLPLSFMLMAELANHHNIEPRAVGELVRQDFDLLQRDPLTLTPEELDDYLVIRLGALLACVSFPRSSVIW